MVFKRLKQLFELDEETSPEEIPVVEPSPNDEAHVSADAAEMDEWFGQLRSMLHEIPDEPTFEESLLIADKLLALLSDAYAAAPEVYTDQWRPYLNGFDLAPLYNHPLFNASDRASLVELNTLLPNAVPRRYAVNLKHDADAIACAQDDTLHHVTSLSLNISSLGASGQEALVQSPHLRRVEMLTVGGDELSAIGELICRWPTPLKMLYAVNISWTLSELERWRASGAVECLTSLAFRNTDWTAEQLTCLFDGAVLPELTGLSVQRDYFSVEDASPKKDQLGDVFLELFSRCDLPNMSSLTVANMSVTSEGIEHLLSWDGLAQLKHLGVEKNLIDEADVLSLVEYGHWASLEMLNVRGVELSSSTQDLLVTHHNLPAGLKIVYGEFNMAQGMSPSLVVMHL